MLAGACAWFLVCWCGRLQLELVPSLAGVQAQLGVALYIKSMSGDGVSVVVPPSPIPATVWDDATRSATVSQYSNPSLVPPAPPTSGVDAAGRGRGGRGTGRGVFTRGGRGGGGVVASGGAGAASRRGGAAPPAAAVATPVNGAMGGRQTGGGNVGSGAGAGGVGAGGASGASGGGAPVRVVPLVDEERRVAATELRRIALRHLRATIAHGWRKRDLARYLRHWGLAMPGSGGADTSKSDIMVYYALQQVFEEMTGYVGVWCPLVVGHVDVMCVGVCEGSLTLA